VACTQLDGVPVAVTGSNDATARVWELRESGLCHFKQPPAS